MIFQKDEKRKKFDYSNTVIFFPKYFSSSPSPPIHYITFKKPKKFLSFFFFASAAVTFAVNYIGQRRIVDVDEKIVHNFIGNKSLGKKKNNSTRKKKEKKKTWKYLQELSAVYGWIFNCIIYYLEKKMVKHNIYITQFMFFICQQQKQ